MKVFNSTANKQINSNKTNYQKNNIKTNNIEQPAKRKMYRGWVLFIFITIWAIVLFVGGLTIQVIGIFREKTSLLSIMTSGSKSNYFWLLFHKNDLINSGYSELGLNIAFGITLAGLGLFAIALLIIIWCIVRQSAWQTSTGTFWYKFGKYLIQYPYLDAKARVRYEAKLAAKRRAEELHEPSQSVVFWEHLSKYLIPYPSLDAKYRAKYLAKQAALRKEGMKNNNMQHQPSKSALCWEHLSKYLIPYPSLDAKYHAKYLEAHPEAKEVIVPKHKDHQKNKNNVANLNPEMPIGDSYEVTQTTEIINRKPSGTVITKIVTHTKDKNFDHEADKTVLITRKTKNETISKKTEVFSETKPNKKETDKIVTVTDKTKNAKLITKTEVHKDVKAKNKETDKIVTIKNIKPLTTSVKKTITHTEKTPEKTEIDKKTTRTLKTISKPVAKKPISKNSKPTKNKINTKPKSTKK